MILIPQHLVREDADGKYVEIIEGKRKIRREVKTGLADGSGSIIIESGLSENELVLVEQK